MQSRIFVFAGILKEKTAECLSLLSADLSDILAAKGTPLQFTLQNKLLTARFHDVSFYVSIFPEEREVDDFYKMAENFELPKEANPIDDVIFEHRLAKRKAERPGFYTDAHYLVARTIFSELEKLDLQAAYLFF